jgi:hypothetical protein
MRQRWDGRLIEGHAERPVCDAEIWILQEVFHVIGSSHDVEVAVAVSGIRCSDTINAHTRSGEVEMDSAALQIATIALCMNVYPRMVKLIIHTMYMSAREHVVSLIQASKLEFTKV